MDISIRKQAEELVSNLLGSCGMEVDWVTTIKPEWREKLIQDTIADLEEMEQQYNV